MSFLIDYLIMKSCEFDDKELDLLNHAVLLLKRDLKFDLETFSRNLNLEGVSHCLDGLSTIEFILPKIKF